MLPRYDDLFAAQRSAPSRVDALLLKEASVTNLDDRVWQRAKKLWNEAGQPAGGANAYLDQATELVAIEDNQKQATRPLKPSERGAPAEGATLAPDEAGPTGEPVEPMQAIENTGEFPTMTDQGEEQAPRREPERQK
jgi:hypothetical protein